MVFPPKFIAGNLWLCFFFCNVLLGFLLWTLIFIHSSCFVSSLVVNYLPGGTVGINGLNIAWFHSNKETNIFNSRMTFEIKSLDRKYLKLLNQRNKTRWWNYFCANNIIYRFIEYIYNICYSKLFIYMCCWLRKAYKA